MKTILEETPKGISAVDKKEKAKTYIRRMVKIK